MWYHSLKWKGKAINNFYQLEMYFKVCILKDFFVQKHSFKFTLQKNHTIDLVKALSIIALHNSIRMLKSKSDLHKYNMTTLTYFYLLLNEIKLIFNCSFYYFIAFITFGCILKICITKQIPVYMQLLRLIKR